jgi:hypothetical protein
MAARELLALNESTPQIEAAQSGDTYSAPRDITAVDANGPGFLNEAASGTNPTLVPDRSDPDTGLGTAGANQATLVAGGVQALNATGASSHAIIDNELHAGITAGTTQTQGGGFQLLSSYNEVSTVATTNDTVVLPTAVAGRVVEIINNGANTLQIFPASGDDLGNGADAATTLNANDVRTYRASDATNWSASADTGTRHTEMLDEENTDAFVINDAGGDQHVYHTNGLAQGDNLGWTFDAGGGGTSFPIASIADGADSGVDIAVTTTGSHGLAQGDIISQTNLADAAYVGVFAVKAIISPTVYEVAAVYTATGTGTMDQAATLTCDTGQSGTYQISWQASATSATNNETFDFCLLNNASVVAGSRVRRKFGTAADYGSFSGGAIQAIADGDKISLALNNNDSAGNITIRNLTISLIRL